MEKLELYAYTTESNKRDGKVKVGHCLVGRHKQRVREQFGTSNSEPPEIILLGSLPDGINSI